ncbi:MAG: hypothetical protein KBD64_02365 [Gammaproteobacteria bacterium]|nr:hypothetical protein [Gammaproteobacteria bacterium]
MLLLKLSWSIIKLFVKIALVGFCIYILININKSYGSDSIEVPLFQELMDYYSFENQKKIQEELQAAERAQGQMSTAESYKSLLESGEQAVQVPQYDLNDQEVN